MRLLQLARKVGVPSPTITQILSKNKYEITKGKNEKLTEEQVFVVYKELGVNNFINSPKTDEVKLSKMEFKGSEETIKEVKDVSDNNDQIIPANIQTSDESLLEQKTERHEKVVDKPKGEVIRANPMKLKGIKVLGKIELPDYEAKKINQKELNSNKKPQRKRLKQRAKKKPILSFEQKLEIEERQRIKRKREREKLIKERKKAYFEKRIKNNLKKSKKSTNKKSPVLFQESPNKEITSQIEIKKTHQKDKSVVVRFWRWLMGD